MKNEPKYSKTDVNGLGLLVADHISAMLAYWDKNQVCRFANHAYIEWFGKSREDMVDKITMKELLGSLYEQNIPYINEVLKGNPQKFERTIKIPSGEIRHTIANYYPDMFNGEVRGFFVHVADISGNKKLEQELVASELKFRGLLESAPDAIIIINNKGLIEIVNAQTEMLFGYTRNELLGKTVESIIPERFSGTHAGKRSGFFSKPSARAMGIGLELFGLHKSGKEFPVEISLSPIEWLDGLYVSAAIRDVTLRKQTEFELKESNERNKIFVQQAPGAIAMFDTEMRYLAASQQWIEDYKLTGKEITGCSHYEIFPEIGEDWKEIHRKCLKGAIDKCDEAYFERADGSVHWIKWDVRPWYISGGSIGGLLMYTADITHLKQKDLEKSRIEYILEKSNEIAKIATWETDAKTNKSHWSKIANEIFELPEDYQPDVATALNFFKEGESRNKLLVAVKKSTEEGIPYDLELQIITGKGKTKWIRQIGEAEFYNGTCKRRFGILQDITHSKKIEEDLHMANEELNAIFNSGYVSIISTNKQGLITNFNKGAELMLQYSASEMVGVHTPEIIHKEEEVATRGKELSVLFGRPIFGFNVFVEMALQEKYESREWMYVRKDGSTFPVQLVVTTLRNNDTELTGFLGVAVDITEIKNAENEIKYLLEITKDQNERLKNFAHIVSHNLRSHSGNLNMLLNLFTDEYPQLLKEKIMVLLKQAVGSLEDTIGHLNEVVHINTLLKQSLSKINLYQAINNIISLFSEPHVKFINKVSPSIDIMGVLAYTDSILLNLITNSIKYCSHNGDSFVEFSALVNDEYVILLVKDNGLGIDLKKYGEKIFGMYKTFHGNKYARGIGLFITKNQIEAMGGKVEVESEVNKGTTFKLFFKYGNPEQNDK